MFRFSTAGIAVVAIVLIAGQALAAPIDPFVGTYEGTAIVDKGKELTKRDLNVTIKKEDDGFSVDWTTVIHKADGDKVNRQYKIVFQDTNRPTVFSAAMRRNAFGSGVPLDPIKGQPYFWAAVRGKTLYVHGIHVTEDGGYELQVYERELTPQGMTIRFKRIRNDKFLKDITGQLKRVK